MRNQVAPFDSVILSIDLLFVSSPGLETLRVYIV